MLIIDIPSYGKGDIMRVKEILTWRVENTDHAEYYENIDYWGNSECFQDCIDFVLSIGKKCDSVGWSELDMDEPDADEVLDKIRDLCKKPNWRAVGCYERTYEDFDSDWYELKATSFKENTMLDVNTVEADTGSKLYFEVISAFHEIDVAPKESHYMCVPDRFRKACIKNGITNVDFCWIKDKGRYEAEQYFYIFPRVTIPRIIYDRSITTNMGTDQTEKFKALGGYLPKIASIISKIEYFELQDCYLKEDMPSGGIACVYCSDTHDFCGRRVILIHKDTAEMLLKEKALKPANLVPVCVVDKCPAGYELDPTDVFPRPTKQYMESCFKSYEKLMSKGRPEYVVKESDALKFLKRIKRKRTGEFNKKISKKNAEKISDAIYNSILPYYLVCDGGLLSSEYTFLSYDESLNATKEFFEDLENEELITEKPKGVVIATCADGDAVLFTDKKEVIRVSHEVPEIICLWQNLAKFFADALNDD